MYVYIRLQTTNTDFKSISGGVLGYRKEQSKDASIQIRCSYWRKYALSGHDEKRHNGELDHRLSYIIMVATRSGEWLLLEVVIIFNSTMTQMSKLDFEG